MAPRSVFFPDLATTPGPFSPLQKFKLFVNNSLSGHALLGSTASAGIGQARDSLPGYGQGAEGYAKRFGASMARGATSNFFSNFLLASALHQDPRYFVKGSDNFGDGVKYALKSVVVTRTDSGKHAINWSGLLGPLASEGIANSYLPSTDRTASHTFRRYGIDIAFRAGGNVLRENWPVIFKKLRVTKLATNFGMQPPANPSMEPTAGSPPPEFGGTYDKLRPEQRRLVDDWFERYNQRTHRNLDPATGYDAVPISIRTTFEAVTHALITTPLTAKDGQPAGNALDLVELVETARGRVPRAKGDLQFRVYVALKPGAIDLLNSSHEFTRKADNTVFHHGYPLNYRQGGGDPSIQISVSPDGKRADIDVDYRSSGFPNALFNGHLTAANSDIRAGNNYNGHLQRWDGLANWWRNLFGLPIEHDSGFAPDTEHDIPANPRITDKAKLEDAVTDYLSTWLVARKPNLAIAYFSSQAYACTIGLGTEADTNLDAKNPIPRTLWNDMEETNFLVGHPVSLEKAVAPVDISDPSLLPIVQNDPRNFTLVKVPDDLAARFDCASEPPSPQPRRKYGKYYASAFRIRVPNGDDAPVFLLWQRQGGYWKIVAWQTDPPEVKDGPVPAVDETTSVAQDQTPKLTPADPAMAQRIQSFFDTLFVNRDFDSAFLYFAPSAYQCINQSLGPDQKPADGSKEAGEYLRQDLKQIVGHESSSHKLEDIIASYDPGDSSLSVVPHAHDRAYLLTTISNAEDSNFRCGSNPAGNSIFPGTTDFATFFQLVEAGGETAGLGLLWSKEDGDWKIVAYRVDEP